MGTDIPEAINEMLEEFTQRISSTEKGPSGLIFKHYLSVSFAFNIFSHQYGAHPDNFYERLPACINHSAFIPPSKNRVANNTSCFINAITDYFHHNELSLQNIDFSNIKTKTTFGN